MKRAPIKNNLSQKRLKELVRYKPSTGVFSWRTTLPNGRGGKGVVLGNLMNGGYLRVNVDHTSYLLHRLAFLYMTGSFPVEFVDHINGVRSDNRWKNLRECNFAINQQNRRAISSHKASDLPMGVTPAKQEGRYIARINNRHLGTFGSADDAHAEYLKHKRILHSGYIP